MRWGKLTAEIEEKEAEQREAELRDYQRRQSDVRYEVECFREAKKTHPARYYGKRFAWLPCKLSTGRWVWLGEYHYEKCCDLEQGLAWFPNPDGKMLYYYAHYWEKRT